VRAYIQKGAVADALFVLPNDNPVASVSAYVYGADGVQIGAERTPTHPSWPLSAGASEGDDEIVVTGWGSDRVPQSNDEITISDATDPFQEETESQIVNHIGGTTIELLQSLFADWDAGAIVQPRILRVPLTAVDTATLGRLHRVAAAVTLHASVPETERVVYPSPFLFDVVNHSPACTLSLGTLRIMYPNLFGKLSGSLNSEQGGVESLRDRAFVLVLADLARKLRPDFLYSDSDLEQPTVYRMMLLMAEDGRLHPDDPDRRSVIRDSRGDYRQIFDEALSSMGWVDMDGNEKPEEGEINVSVRPRLTVGT
jgi:hypothetical protein